MTLDRRITVRLDEALHAALEREAETNGRTVGQTVRRLLVLGLSGGRRVGNVATAPRAEDARSVDDLVRGALDDGAERAESTGTDLR